MIDNQLPSDQAHSVMSKRADGLRGSGRDWPEAMRRGAVV